MHTTMEIPKGYMMDPQGRLVPKNKVKSVDRGRDDLVRDLVKKARDVHTTLSAFKVEAMEAVKGFVARSAEEYGVEMGGAKGNVTLTSYDGAFKVQISVNDYVTFDERLQVAKELIDNCIRRWSKGSRSEIKVLVEDAFKVDKQGKVDTKRILGLRRLDITDDEWQRAMEAISDSVTVAVSKEYIRLYQRDDEGNYHQLALDIAAV
jgi:hypothetical protein